MNLYQEVILGIYLALAFILPWFLSLIFRKSKSAPVVTQEKTEEIEEYDDNTDTFEIKRDELMFDLIKRRFDSEISRWDGLDTKAGSLIGFVSIVTSLTLAAGSFSLQDVLNNTQVLIAFFVGIGFLLTSITFSLLCVKVRKAPTVPNTERLISGYQDKSYRETLLRNGAQMSEAVRKLEGLNNKKAKWIRYSWTLFVIALGYLFLVFVLFTLSNPHEPSEVEKLAKIIISRIPTP